MVVHHEQCCDTCSALILFAHVRMFLWGKIPRVKTQPDPAELYPPTLHGGRLVYMLKSRAGNAGCLKHPNQYPAIGVSDSANPSTVADPVLLSAELPGRLDVQLENQ